MILNKKNEKSQVLHTSSRINSFGIRCIARSSHTGSCARRWRGRLLSHGCRAGEMEQGLTNSLPPRHKGKYLYVPKKTSPKSVPKLVERRSAGRKLQVSKAFSQAWIFKPSLKWFWTMQFKWIKLPLRSWMVNYDDMWVQIGTNQSPSNQKVHPKFP